MIRITRETDYGIVLLTTMASDAESSYSAATLAKQHHMPLPMVSKILKALARAGLLTSQRGAQGGYSLTRPPETISAADIVDAIEGPIAITLCSEDVLNGCMYESHCTVSGHWHRINNAIRTALEGISLLDMSRPTPLPVGLFQGGVLPTAGSSNHR
jgi:FeS assembly SUF system regulator